MVCFKCGYKIVLESKKVWRQETCPQCNSHLRCCMNCRFYDPLAAKKCREPEAEFVNDKEIANFCEYFEPSERNDRTEISKAEEAKSKLDQLFNKGTK